MKSLLLLLALVGCHNDAVDLGETVHPGSLCFKVAQGTTWGDVAICTDQTGTGSFFCTTSPRQCRPLGDPMLPRCQP